MAQSWWRDWMISHWQSTIRSIRLLKRKILRACRDRPKKENERGRRKDETRSRRSEMRPWSYLWYTHTMPVSKRRCRCDEIKPGPRESRGFPPSHTPSIPLPIVPLPFSLPRALSVSFFLIVPRFSPCLLARWCPPSRAHKIQPGILISLPLCRAVLVPTHDFDLA